MDNGDQHDPEQGGIVPPYIQERIRILKRVCPVCNAQPYEPCTIPTSKGRLPVRWFHLAREYDEETSGEECPGDMKEKNETENEGADGGRDRAGPDLGPADGDWGLR